MGFKILYGTAMGTSQDLAEKAAAELGNSEVINMQDISVADIANYNNLLIITSTWGDGEAPPNAEELLDSLKADKKIDLSNVKYAVFGIGQSFYEKFCQAAIDFDEVLEAKGAKRALPLVKSDDNYDEDLPLWLESIKKAF